MIKLFKPDCYFIVTGDKQNVRQSDGAQDEPATRQQAQHATRSATHEQAQTS